MWTFCRFSHVGLTVTAKTIANFIEKAWLYEQERSAVLAELRLRPTPGSESGGQ
jgi:hypothetical protein